MELHIKDRIYFPQLLPAQNSFMEFNLKREIMKKVGLTEQDKADYNIQEDRENGRITWDVEKDLQTPMVVDFTKEELAYLKKGCESLAETQAPDDFWSVVEKIYDAAQ